MAARVQANNSNEIFVVSKNLETKAVTNKASSIDNENPADFETAISATKFGKFNLMLFLITIPTGWSNMFESTIMSYVVPAAQCDLNLSLENKGSLNAITFLGMIISGVFWGYLSDRFGRKKLIVFGYFINCFFVILSAFSQTYVMLIVSKFFSGLIVNGPFLAFVTYLSEFHGVKYRSRVELLRALIFTSATIALPLLAWVILPLNINFSLWNDSIVIHSWNVYLFVSAIPPLISGIIFIFLPESPKFLMTAGKNEEALKIFRKIYSLNTGETAEKFPIKKLIEEKKFKNNNSMEENEKTKKNFKQNLQELKPLCYPPYLKSIILICFAQSCIMISTSTLRLWLPQIFQALSDYQFYTGQTDSLCTMLEVLQPKNGTQNCSVNFYSSVYINNIIIACACIFGYILAGSLINFLGKKKILIIFGLISSCSAFGIYFAQNPLTVLILSSIFLSLAGACRNVIISTVIDLFPTTFRTLTLSLMMSIGRTCIVVGNLVFPIVLQISCAIPFLSIGTLITILVILSILLPNTDMKPLQ